MEGWCRAAGCGQDPGNPGNPRDPRDPGNPGNPGENSETSIFDNPSVDSEESLGKDFPKVLT